MSKNSSSAPPPYGPPPAAPPTYAQAVGGVPPTSPYIPNHKILNHGPEILTTVVPVGSNATHMICPHCHVEIDTTTKTKPGLIAYLAGALICLIGCPLGCCLIPCCIDKCMDVEHICPNCRSYLGTYKR
ncbi:LITAF domain-containing protein [Aethina tumida]|uniref:LITAF domain-containing protein n=1 Tax=Aethina tumida TaxID=116153 RepID=UPI00096B21DF|nr:LITAF domain-containing protein [Aethina tumida]